MSEPNQLQTQLEALNDFWSKIPQMDTPYEALGKVCDPGAYSNCTELIHRLSIDAQEIAKLNEPVAFAEFDRLHPVAKQTILDSISQFRTYIADLAETIATNQQNRSPDQVKQRVAQTMGRLNADWRQHLVALNSFRSQVETRREVDEMRRQLDELKASDSGAGAAQAATAAQLAAQDANLAAETARAETQAQAAVLLGGKERAGWSIAVTAHEEAAAWWLKAAAVTVICLVRYLVWASSDGDKLGWFFGPVFYRLEPGSDVGQIVTFAITKVVVASALIGMCLFAARNYQSHMHNVVVNRQRELSMQGLPLLYKAMGDAEPASRADVLRQAVQTIFSHTNSGFLERSKNELQPLLGLCEEAIKTSLGKKE